MTFKQRDIRPCAACGKRLAATGSPAFWRVHLERFALDAGAVQRQHGLELRIGGLASVMGPDENMAVGFDGPRTILICEPCVLASPGIAIAFFREAA